MADIIFGAGFTEDGVALTSVELAGGDAPTVSVIRITRADNSEANVVTGAATTYSATARTWRYRLATANLATYEYHALFTTTYATADQRDVWARGSIDAGQYATQYGYLTGDAFVRIDAAGAGLTALGDARLANLDAAVSSRSVYAGGAVASVTGDVGGKVLGGGAGVITGTGARVVDAAGNNVAPAATALSTATWTNLRAAALDNLDATISGIAAAVWTYGTRTLTSLATLVASIAAAVWAYATRTLTQSAASVAAAVAGTSVSVQHATKWVVAITGLGNISNRDDLLLTVKDREADTDALAVLQVSEASGLIRLNGAAIALPLTAAKATLVVDDPVAGNITLTVSSDVTAQIGLSAARIWDVKRIYDDPATVGILDDMPASGVGAWVVAPIVTKTTS